MHGRVPCLYRSVGIIVAVTLLFLSGCATYSATFQPIETELAAQRPAEALAVLEKQRPARKDEVLYLLNKGMLLRMSGQLNASNEVLETAKQRMKALYALSLREQSIAFVINDATRSYVGEEYEQILLYAYKALNYLELGQHKKARVEVMQMDVRLHELGKTGREVEAFGRYVAGMVFEQRREWNDAMVAYRKAYKAYKRQREGEGEVPHFLQFDLLRLAQRQGLKNEVKNYRAEFSISDWQSVGQRAKRGELVFLLHYSLAPLKREHSLMTVADQSSHIVRISLPYYPDNRAPVTGLRITIDDRSFTASRVEDIDAVARHSLQIKMAAITARAIVRAVIKAKLAEEARKESKNNNSLLFGFLTEIATLATERADTRSWTTLPYAIYMVRVSLPPGNYDVRAEIGTEPYFAINSRVFGNLTIKKGQYTYLNYHWVPPDIHRRR